MPGLYRIDIWPPRIASCRGTPGSTAFKGSGRSQTSPPGLCVPYRTSPGLGVASAGLAGGRLDRVPGGGADRSKRPARVASGRNGGLRVLWLASQWTQRLRTLESIFGLSCPKSDQLLLNDQRVIGRRNLQNVGEWDFANASLSTVRLQLGDLVQRLRQAAFSPADFDGNGEVDLLDTNHFLSCMSGPGVPPNDSSCQDADLNGDGTWTSPILASCSGYLSGETQSV